MAHRGERYAGEVCREAEGGRRRDVAVAAVGVAKVGRRSALPRGGLDERRQQVEAPLCALDTQSRLFPDRFVAFSRQLWGALSVDRRGE